MEVPCSGLLPHMHIFTTYFTDVWLKHNDTVYMVQNVYGSLYDSFGPSFCLCGMGDVVVWSEFSLGHWSHSLKWELFWCCNATTDSSSEIGFLGSQ